MFFSFNFALFRAHNFTTSSILSRFISYPYFQVVLWMAIQPQTSPGFTLASLSVWGITSWQQDEFFRYSTLVMLLKVNSAVLLRMRLAHSYKILPWQFKVTLVSVLLPHEALGIDFPALLFLSCISCLWIRGCEAQQEIGVLMFYHHRYRFAGLANNLQCPRFHSQCQFPKMSSDHLIFLACWACSTPW